MATKESDIVENAIKETMIAFEKYSPTAFDLLNSQPEEKAKVLEAARAIAEEEVKLAEIFKEPPKEEEVREILAKHLPEHRVALIEQGFLPQTYQIHITKKMDGVFYADFIRDEKPIFSQKKLDTELAISTTKSIQIASIIVEAVLFVLRVVGVDVSISCKNIRDTIEDLLSVIENSRELRKAIEALQKAMNGGSIWERAKAIYNLLKELRSLGVLWDTIKSLCGNMSFWEWVRTIAAIISLIYAAVRTGGSGLIANIRLALNSAYGFTTKLKNLNELDRIKT